MGVLGTYSDSPAFRQAAFAAGKERRKKKRLCKTSPMKENEAPQLGLDAPQAAAGRQLQERAATEAKEAAQRVQTLQQEVDAHKAALQESRKLKEGADAEAEDAKRALGRLQSTVQALEKKLADEGRQGEAKATEQAAEVKEAEAKLQAKAAALHRSQQEAGELKKKLSAAHDSIQEAKKAQDADAERHAETIAEAERREADTAAERDRLTRNLEAKTKQLSKLSKERGDLLQALSGCQGELEALRQAHAALAAEKKGLGIKLSAAQRVAAQHGATVRAFEAHAKEANEAQLAATAVAEEKHPLSRVAGPDGPVPAAPAAPAAPPTLANRQYRFKGRVKINESGAEHEVVVTFTPAAQPSAPDKKHFLLTAAVEGEQVIRDRITRKMTAKAVHERWLEYDHVTLMNLDSDDED
eukprot:g2516.t1